AALGLGEPPRIEGRGGATPNTPVRGAGGERGGRAGAVGGGKAAEPTASLSGGGPPLLAGPRSARETGARPGGGRRAAPGRGPGACATGVFSLRPRKHAARPRGAGAP